MHYADHVAKEWDNSIQLTHYLVNWKKTHEPIQRHTDKMLGKAKKKNTNKIAEANENNKGNCSYWNEKQQSHMTALAN
jgi:hypothetical protein